jgi:hypothetical protein
MSTASSIPESRAFTALAASLIVLVAAVPHAEATHEASPSKARFVAANGEATLCPSDTNGLTPALGVGGTCHHEPDQGALERATVEITVAIDRATPGQPVGLFVALDDGEDRDRFTLCAENGEPFDRL